MYFYESHMGGIYSSEEMVAYDSLHCETCGDIDTLIGSANTKDEAWKLLYPYMDREITPESPDYKEYLDEEGELMCCNTGGYSKEDIEEELNSIDW